MRRAPRGLSAEEAALWARLAATVTPLHPPRPRPAPSAPPPAAPAEAPAAPAAKPPPKFVKPAKVKRPGAALRPAAPPPPPPRPEDAATGLDSHWERRLGKAGIAPDLTLDLHGHTLAQAHARLDAGLAQALAMGARIVLVITGRPRPVEAADRAHGRGAIRAKLLDWLAAGPHAAAIAAVRPAHRRHGGEGALYLVLRRRRP